MSGAVHQLDRAARVVGVSRDEFIALVKGGEMPRPRYLKDSEPFWLHGDLEEALYHLPYADGTCAPRKIRPRVYFIGAAAAAFIKVGKANNVEGRVKELQTGNPERLIVYATLDGDKHLEGLFHSALKGVRAEGEWFQRGPWFDAVRDGVLAAKTPAAILEDVRASLK